MPDFHALLDAASYAGFDADELRDIAGFLEELRTAPGLADVFLTFANLYDAQEKPETFPEAEWTHRYGLGLTRRLCLALALSRVPVALKRRERLGIGDSINQRTIADLALWSRTLQQWDGELGLSCELLSWANSYLSGHLVRMGSIQFELYDFDRPLFVYRQPRERTLLAFHRDDDNSFRPCDMSVGQVSKEHINCSERDQLVAQAGARLALAPGWPLLRMHFPRDARWEVAVLFNDIADALALLNELFPEVKPVGVCGEAWFFDPAFNHVMRNEIVRRLSTMAHFYPSAVPEAKTIRRLFGPSTTRADLSSYPADKLSSLQKMIVSHLADPSASLQARGAFGFLSEFRSQPEYPQDKVLDWQRQTES